MYVPARFAARDDRALLAELGRRLGLLVTHGIDGLFASHLPFLLDAEGHLLEGHLARSNPHRSLAGGDEALVVYQGAEGYISPGDYPSKARDPRRVPTWNYEAVHVYGELTWFDEPDALRDLMARLSAQHEAARPDPWRIDDAPADYLEHMVKAIVGIRIRITRVEAKQKLSQDKPDEDREGAIQGLLRSGDGRDHELAARMRAPGPRR